MQYNYKDISLYYEIHGTGTPILMLHGFMPDHRLMKGCMELSNLEGYQRIYVDLPGMGQSTTGKWLQKADDMLDILLSFINHIFNKSSFLLCGESYGGYLARGILSHLKGQVIGLMLICPVIEPDSKNRNLPPHRILVKDETLLAQLEPEDAEGFSAMSVIQNKVIYNRYVQEIVAGVKIAQESFLETYQAKGYSFSFDVDKRVGGFEKPTLVLVGRQDAVVGYVDALNLLEKYPRSTFAILDAAGHNLQIEQSELFNTLTLEWLKRTEWSHESF
ncbi:MAG: alpha/beta hydrolase [Clostridia bacterium]|nr:alpha/beta hydrolase [Clostridia bacterium]